MKKLRAWLNFGVLLGYALPVMTWFYLVSHFSRHPFEESLKNHCRRLFSLLGVKVLVKGNLQPLHRNSVIIMPNHISYLDLPLLFGFLKVPLCGLEDHRHFKWPLFGKIIARIGNIPVDRRNPLQSFKAAGRLKSVSADRQVVIFPEAGRSRDGHLMALKRMPFQVAKAIDRPILPCYIYGMADVNKKVSPFIYPGEIVIFVRPLIELPVVRHSELDELKEKVASELSFAPFVRPPSQS